MTRWCSDEEADRTSHDMEYECLKRDFSTDGWRPKRMSAVQIWKAKLEIRTRCAYGKKNGDCKTHPLVEKVTRARATDCPNTHTHTCDEFRTTN